MEPKFGKQENLESDPVRVGCGKNPEGGEVKYRVGTGDMQMWKV